MVRKRKSYSTVTKAQATRKDGKLRKGCRRQKLTRVKFKGQWHTLDRPKIRYICPDSVIKK